MTEEIKNAVDTPHGGAVSVEARMPQVTLSPEALISQAIDKAVPVETMEKLLAMRTQLKQESARETFMFNLSCFQGDCPVIVKNKVVKNKNGSPRYVYAPLDDIVSQVRELLKRYGFSYTIETRDEQDPAGQRSICTVHHVEGHSRSSEFWAPIDKDSYMSDQQKWAAASTYGKRYAFCNAFGILTGDEDNDARPMNGKAPAQPAGLSFKKFGPLSKQMLKDISHDQFGGHIPFGGVQTDLDEVIKKTNVWLAQGPYPDSVMEKAADRIAQMLLIAVEMDRDVVEVVKETVQDLSDKEVADIFQGTLVDTTNTEGNLSNGE